MNKPLTKAQRVKIRQHSPAAIEKALSSMIPTFQRKKWIESTNTYRTNCTKRLEGKFTPNTQLRSSHLAKYIAVSAPLHCADGWSYLGRAIDASIQGDADCARHLAYYAELRASVALLATQGIGIFNNQHYIVDNLGDCQSIGGRYSTHHITWKALSYWSELKTTSHLVGQVIVAGSVTLSDWIETLSPSSYQKRELAKRWFREWGADLARLAKDRDARNEASYRPTRLNNRMSLSPSISMSFIRDIWLSCRPGVSSRFEEFDRLLVHNTLRATYQGMTGTAISPSNFHTYEAALDSVLNDLHPQSMSHISWLSFLSKSSSSQVFDEAAKSYSVTNAHHHISVIARATILLRIATGFTDRLLRRAGCSANDLKFWSDHLGEDRGLWRPGDSPNQAADLWIDIEEALQNVDDWNNLDKTDSAFDFLSYNAHSINVLGTCERIVLWGLGL